MIAAQDADERLRVLRVYHGGRDASHRERERALARCGIQITLVIPAEWPGGQPNAPVAEEGIDVLELPIVRPGDVNRHAYRDRADLCRLIAKVEPDLLDIHEEPFSLAARQWLKAAPRNLPIVMYTAQNLDKRYPPPFAQYERTAYRRVGALYPCSAQAASVARGKGFSGNIRVLPLGYNETVFRPGTQSVNDNEIVLALVGRLVPEKGVLDAVRVLAHVNRHRPAKLLVIGQGPEEVPARELAGALGVADRLELRHWQSMHDLAEAYKSSHVVLVPSRPTRTWVEQFGRVIIEAQASGAIVAGYESGSIPEVAGGAALLERVGSADALATAVVAVLSDRSAYERLRTKGLARAAELTWEHIAARQADLYRSTAANAYQRVQLPRSPRNRRAAARNEFGPSASTAAGERPFALPVLRRGGVLAAGVAAVIDSIVELSTRAASSGRKG